MKFNCFRKYSSQENFNRLASRETFERCNTKCNTEDVRDVIQKIFRISVCYKKNLFLGF